MIKFVTGIYNVNFSGFRLLNSEIGNDRVKNVIS